MLETAHHVNDLQTSSLCSAITPLCSVMLHYAPLCSACGQYSSEEILQRWRVIRDIVLDFTGVGIEPPASLIDSDVFNHYSNSCIVSIVYFK